MASSLAIEYKLISAAVVLIIIGFVLASVIGAEVGVYTLWLGLIAGVLGLGLLISIRIRRWVRR